MRPRPDWWTNEYWQRYVDCQVYTINRYINTSFQAKIASVQLDESTGVLTFTYAWSAIGVDANNRRSLTSRHAWVDDVEPMLEMALWVNMEGQLMPLYVARNVSDGRLILDGGELMEAIFTFMPAGHPQEITPDVIRPDNPDNPIDRRTAYVAGHIPGGTILPTGHSGALYGMDDDGDPRRLTLGDDGT